MRPVSDKFLATVESSHRVVFRARLVIETPSFGLNPLGAEIPILGGDVKLDASSDIKSTLDLEVPGEYWNDVLPFGKEIFVERGIDYGDGTREWVGLGYFRIDDIDQPDAPNGPIRISGSDRISRMKDNRTLWTAPGTLPSYPAQTVRVAFNRWVNGDPFDTGSTPSVDNGYGMFLFDVVPINWLGLDPDNYSAANTLVEDSTYDYLQGLLSNIGNYTMRFNASGELDVISTDVLGNPSVYSVEPGRNLIGYSRNVSREGFANVVTTKSSDPAYPGILFVGYNEEPNFGWESTMGQVIARFSSPLIKSTAHAESASVTRLANLAEVPYGLSVLLVPNPALEPFDVIDVRINPTLVEQHMVDSVVIPLTADGDVEIKTRVISETTVVEQ